jgi:hypothetical protein
MIETDRTIQLAAGGHAAKERQARVHAGKITPQRLVKGFNGFDTWLRHLCLLWRDAAFARIGVEPTSPHAAIC